MVDTLHVYQQILVLGQNEDPVAAELGTSVILREIELGEEIGADEACVFLQQRYPRLWAQFQEQHPGLFE
jgi:hypothetical protein